MLIVDTPCIVFYDKLEEATMTLQAKEVVLAQVAEITADHECPYGKRLDRLSASLGTATYLTILLQELTTIHESGDCPPTHIDSSPTRVWSDWVDDTAS